MFFLSFVFDRGTMELSHLVHIGMRPYPQRAATLRHVLEITVASKPLPPPAMPVPCRFVPVVVGFQRNGLSYKKQAVIGNFLRKETPNQDGALPGDLCVEAANGKHVAESKGKSKAMDEKDRKAAGTDATPTDLSLYSAFDEEGFPTADANGVALTKNQYKKIRKLFEVERKKTLK
eukprot:GEMP01105061.1.p1 GENE.GEMP01105061.1~~GEMP01105061.1.p1  ORF type:complete len:176 (+),score=41.15 GEMP01105061.1:30-557(+)